MKKYAFPTGFLLTVFLLLFVLCLGALFVSPLPAAYSEEEHATVYLPENRFADFMFEPSTGNSVIITVTNLDDRISYRDFKTYILLKTRSGSDVPFDYQPLDSGALIGFTLPNESVYLTLKEELNELPGAERKAPEIDTKIPLTVDPASYLAATSSVRSGTVTLNVSSRTENDDMMSRTTSYFEDNNLKIGFSYHFDLELRLLKIGAEKPVNLYFGSEGKKLKIKIELPDYNKKYDYALICDLGAQGVSIKPLIVSESNGFYFVDAELKHNGSFSVVAYSSENFPWWAVVLIVVGGLLIAGGGALLGLYLKKKHNPKERLKKKDDVPLDEKKQEEDKKDSKPEDKESQTVDK